jgi:ADP-heptose:LPS heptosyltransferase
MARERVRRILAVKLDHLGDFIAAFPALRRLKERFPEAELDVLCATGSLALAKLEPSIDHAFDFNLFHARSGDGERPITQEELLALKRRLSGRGYDVAIDLRMHADTRHILQYTGASLLAGYEYDSRFPWLDVALPWEGDASGQAKRAHISDRLIQLAEALSLACESDRPSLRSPTPAKAKAYLKRLLSKEDAPAAFFSGIVACVHPGVGNELRQWPEEHFASLIDLLVNDLKAAVVVIGAGNEEQVAKRVLDKVTFPQHVLSLVGKTKIKDLPYLLRACSLYVGNNSGPKHLAAALGVPTVGVHSAVVDAVEWAPLGSNAVALRRNVVCGPCYLSSPAECTRRMACLVGLRPQEVFSTCRRLLQAA